MDGIALALTLAASVAAQGLGTWFTSRSVTAWYPTLVKPTWTPPAWVFAPVWTALYVQLALNVLWSALFFGMRSPGAGPIEILALWAAIGGTLVGLWRIRRLAGWLLVPYVFWVSYAAGLNWALWRLNG
jgi:tryptophan-rich sensory protein